MRERDRLLTDANTNVPANERGQQFLIVCPVRILTDSIADIPEARARELHTTVVPLLVRLDNPLSR